jgi:hypothetical protein
MSTGIFLSRNVTGTGSQYEVFPLLLFGVLFAIGLVIQQRNGKSRKPALLPFGWFLGLVLTALGLNLALAMGLWSLQEGHVSNFSAWMIGFTMLVGLSGIAIIYLVELRASKRDILSGNTVLEEGVK